MAINKYIGIFIVILCINYGVYAKLSQQTYSSFDGLYDATKLKLTPKSKGGNFKTVLTFGDIQEVLEEYFNLINDKNSDLRNKDIWLQKETPKNIFNVSQENVYKYDFSINEPFVEKRVLPVGSRVAIHGDLHGGFFELLEFIKHHMDKGDINNDFVITSDDFYMLFLGDYTDRGIFGLEVVYTLLRLKLANPDRVFIVRGNHEDYALNFAMGFFKECEAKFPSNSEWKNLYRAINYMYESFPVALYLGSGKDPIYYFQANHGGMEIGFDPNALLADFRSHVFTLLKKLEQLDQYQNIPEELQDRISASYFSTIDLLGYKDPRDARVKIGFLWNDFFVDDKNVHEFDENRGHKYGKELTHHVLSLAYKEAYKIVGVLRAHQHGDPEMMKSISDWMGISRIWTPSEEDIKRGLWQGIVCTFSVAPDVGYGNTYDAFGILTFGKTFEESTLEVFQVDEAVLYNKKTIKKQSEKKEKNSLVLGQTLNDEQIEKLFSFDENNTFKAFDLVAIKRSDGSFTLGYVSKVVDTKKGIDIHVEFPKKDKKFTKILSLPDAKKSLGKINKELESKARESINQKSKKIALDKETTIVLTSNQKIKDELLEVFDFNKNNTFKKYENVAIKNKDGNFVVSYIEDPDFMSKKHTGSTVIVIYDKNGESIRNILPNEDVGKIKDEYKDKIKIIDEE